MRTAFTLLKLHHHVFRKPVHEQGSAEVSASHTQYVMTSLSVLN